MEFEQLHFTFLPRARDQFAELTLYIKRQVIAVVNELEEGAKPSKRNASKATGILLVTRFGSDSEFRLVFEANVAKRTYRVIAVGPRSTVYKSLKAPFRPNP